MTGQAGRPAPPAGKEPFSPAGEEPVSPAGKRPPLTAGKRPFRLPAVLLIAAAASLLVWPSLSDSVTEIHRISCLRGFAGLSDGLSDDESAAVLRAAEAYNRKIEKRQEGRLFQYGGEGASDREYESVLAGGSDGIMGYLEIPAIGVHLPVAHGTSSEVLEYECGHMYGSSLPSGGPSTHAVIAGHTGLPTAELFNGLTKLAAGDRFLIHLPGTIHGYAVRRIRVVLPEEESLYLQIEKGRDLVTLYTCTPYGINDHRLLVTGERVLPDPSGETGVTETLRVDRISRKAVLRTAVLASLPAAAAAAGWFGLSSGGGKKKKGGIQ